MTGIDNLQGLKVPVTCKIRVFPEVEKTLAYARMLERAGCSVLAVHGRTREQKQAKAVRADWNIIEVTVLMILLMVVNFHTFSVSIVQRVFLKRSVFSVKMSLLASS